MAAVGEEAEAYKLAAEEVVQEAVLVLASSLKEVVLLMAVNTLEAWLAVAAAEEEVVYMSEVVTVLEAVE